MLQRIIAITFHAAVMLIGAAVAVWLTITGHTLHIGGLLLALGGVLGAVMFGLRLAEGFGPDQISIWAGPISAVRPASLSSQERTFRDAA